MRKYMIILAVLIGLAIGYLAGCRSHSQARLTVPDPEPGQSWVSRDGAIRIVRTVTHQGDHRLVWWHRPNGREIDRHCTVETWRAWAKTKGARP